MVAPRSTPKSRRATSKMAPVPNRPSSPVSDGQNLSEVSLRKLSRAELQKTARIYAIKANIKSEQIIQELLKLQPQKKRRARLADDDREEAPPPKRARHAKISSENTLPKLKSQSIEIPLRKAEKLRQRDLDPGGSAAHATASQPPPTIIREESPKAAVYDPTLFCETDSDRTDSPRPSYGTPKSSRASTPLPSEIYHVERAVMIMREISKNDQEMLSTIAGLRETAAKFRKQAQDTRDVIRAENARRERMEAYFTYWAKTEGTWPPDWLYGPAMIPAKYLKPQGGDNITGPPTLPLGRDAKTTQDDTVPPVSGDATAVPSNGEQAVGNSRGDSNPSSTLNVASVQHS